ncbi:MAG: leucine-rich repeat domain-containing protein, partial [Clostridia bacterium]
NVDNNNTQYKSIDGNLYSKDGTKFLQYCMGKKDTSFILPTSVTSIGYRAFYDCSSLTSITIPSKVTSIGDYAFFGCTKLATVTFEPNSQLTSIGYRAFDGCTSLASVTIPSSVTSIGGYAFQDCTKLAIVKILRADLPIISLGSSAFSNCHASLQIQVPNGVLNDYKTGAYWSNYSAKMVGYN